ncbi:MobF family relaxase [Streptomyces sp. NE06-03E]|uniref:MobF family relaxase n=1 Tax=Streptomyces sp. NE06-03E TaxID=3028695 RepID=UPI0029A239FF|nr:MobF family relaxase [Streptomyces sp. NE06-03E]MDX3055981.1 MobF family relaxase [Streptomyces sp. NE06-03E]
MTAIRDDEQVEYRLREQAGCSVVVSDVMVQDVTDGALEQRLREEGDATLVWMGSGLAATGLTEGAVLDDEGKEAARRLMVGCHPETGARLIRTQTSVRAHERAKLTTARLVEAIEAAAGEKSLTAAELLEGKPKQQKVLAQQQRMVHRQGDRHRMQVTTLHKLARAAGLSLDDIYGEAELAEARAYAEQRVDDRVRGWDLMLDLPKSDSVLPGLMSELDEREYRGLVRRAARDTVREFERWVGYAVGSEGGQPVRLATGGLLAWSVEHRAARPMGDGVAGDPHLHLHVTIANMGLCEDGEWRSIGNSGQDLHRHAAAADAFFKARVRALTHQRFGVRRQQAERTGAWEVDGIPEPVRDLFSRRHGRIVDLAGDEAGRQERDRAAAETLRAKHAADAATMRGSWRQRAEEAGVDVDAMVAAAAPGPSGPDGGLGIDGPGSGPRIPPPADLAALVFHPDAGLTRSDTTFSREQLLAAVGNALRDGIDDGSGRLGELVDDVLDVAGYAVRVPDYGSTVMTSTARYTTQDILDAGEYVRDQALARHGEGRTTLTSEQAAAAIDAFQSAVGFALSDEQRTAVTRLLAGEHGIDTIVGVAGAGRSTLVEACRIGWDAAGTTYAGACLSAVAAHHLTQTPGIPARTVAAWLQRIRFGSGLTGIDVLVIDEATAVDDRSAEVLVREAARTGTRIIGVGDPLQLKAIGAADWYRDVHRLVGGLTLHGNRHQEDAAERHALEVWRTGDHDQALRLLADRGRIHPTESADEARSQILTVWDGLRRDRWPDTHDLVDELVVLAARDADVDALNAGAQQIRRAAGELGTEHTYALPGGDRLTLATGDAVRVRANGYRSHRGEGLDLLNGYRAVVGEIAEDGRIEITWRTRTRGEEATFVSTWLTPDQVASGALSLGYAMTIAASQGMTCDTSLLYGHGANAFATYPGLTRGRQANHLWLPLAVIESGDTGARLGEARTEKERLERALEAFARYLGQSRPAVTVSDLLHEPPAPATVPSPARTQAVRAGAARARSTTVHDQRRREAQPQAGEYRLTGEQKQRLADMVGEREAAGIRAWNRRPYGDRTDEELTRLIVSAPTDARREELAAAEAEETERTLLEQIADGRARGETRGEREVAPVYPLLARADEQLAAARTEQARETAAAQAAAKADERLRLLATADDKGRIALRLAGTSRKEHRQLTQQATEQRAAGWREAADARAAASRAAEAAWEMLRSSPYAAALGATEHQAPDVDTLAARLTEMREVRIPARVQQIDTGDAKRVSHAHGQAVKARENAVMYRAVATDARKEKTLRASIFEEHPKLHESEVKARADLQRTQETRSARVAVQGGRSYQPPAQNRSGPRRSR